jgi:uncharacterized protein (DUF488 family)
MKIFTIGFTHKTAESFFEGLRLAGVKRVADVRLNNTSQLAGFSKKDDLKYFLKTIGAIDYVHLPELAPTKEMFDRYKKLSGQWEVYERDFLALMRRRQIENALSQELLDDACLLCSEATPHHCHRRLVAEYLQRHWPQVSIEHLS